MESLVILCVLLAIGATTWLLDRSLVSAPIILAVSLLLPVVVFDIDVSLLTLIVFVGSTIGFTLPYLFMIVAYGSGANEAKRTIDDFRIDRPELVFICWVLFLLGQAAFLLNLFKVMSAHGVAAYLSVSSKTIELTFGSSTITNYLFFLNIVVAAMAAYLVGSDRGSLPIRLMWGIAVVSLAFSGIKSTLIFGGSIGLFAYLLGSRRSNAIIVSFMAFAAILVVIAMFLFVNLGLTQGVSVADIPAIAAQLGGLFEGYIQYNYLNFDKEILERTDFTLGKFTFFFLTKLFDPEIKGYFDVSEFLVVDKNFNMGTYLREYYVDFGVAGAFGIPLFLGAICGSVRAWFWSTRSAAAAVTLSVLLTACLFAFFGNQFIRLQFIFVVVVAILIQQAAKMLVAMRATVQNLK